MVSAVDVLNVSIELVLCRTPTWDHFPQDKKMVKVLKHSEDGNGNPFDAREMDPVRMVGVDMDQFDSQFWNEHLDFLNPEFEWLDAEPSADESDDEADGLHVVVGLRVRTEDGGSNMRKIKLFCEPVTRVEAIAEAVNAALSKYGVDMKIERLVPLW